MSGCETRARALDFFPMNPTETAPAVKRARVDGNMTGLAGELFVAAELLKLGLQASITSAFASASDRGCRGNMQ